jgi:hypothetical protein
MISDPLVADLQSFRNRQPGQSRFTLTLPALRQITGFKLLCGKGGVSCCCSRRKRGSPVVVARTKGGKREAARGRARGHSANREGNEEEGEELSDRSGTNGNGGGSGGGAGDSGGTFAGTSNNCSNSSIIDFAANNSSTGSMHDPDEEFFIPRLPNIVFIVQVCPLMSVVYSV